MTPPVRKVTFYFTRVESYVVKATSPEQARQMLEEEPEAFLEKVGPFEMRGVHG